MTKPLHKDRSFWIVAITVLVAINAVQLYFTVPWFNQRLAARNTAPRDTNAPAQTTPVVRQEANLDYSKKTYPWQAPRFEPRLLDSPPQVVLIPTEYSQRGNSWGTRRANMAMGICMSADFVLQSAYNWSSRTRMILPTPMPSGQFDFIANLPSGALEALQKEVEKKLGLVAARETRSMDVQLLKVHHADAPGLKPYAPSTTPRSSEPGTIRLLNIANLANFLESMLRMPVFDETGLTGRYDIQLPSAALRPRPPGQGSAIDPAMKQVLLDQLGLELVPTNTPVEVLVVKKVN